MNSFTLRQKFFDFFSRNGHTVVPSSSLIPAHDPTLLFTNAGMNQFKDVFLGAEKRSYTRAASIQKCVRAGGKHNDLDNVGFTARHLTFFEMMGNFSFGDYFKREAIRFAWDFLTKDLGFNPDLLWVTVYKHDDEAYDIWHKEIGIPAERIGRLGEKDNFWQMGDTGPCGPCSEIYVDRGIVHDIDADARPGDDHSTRFIEIWNLVFMQFDRQPDGTDLPLQQVGVDTGMGLERLAMVMQNTPSVYETDIFMPLIEYTETLCGKRYMTSSDDIKAAFRVLADHIRSSSMIIADGGMPSNEGRGYVLRKIIRRAALFSQKISSKNIFPELARGFIDHISAAYPELVHQKDTIVSVLQNETERFATNLVHGRQVIQEYLRAQETTRHITGQQAFKLYDTYGFPLELTRVIAHEAGYSVDLEGFEEAMAAQRAQSGKKTHYERNLDIGLKTVFTGYDTTQQDAVITGLLVDGHRVETVEAGTVCTVITDKSPLYAEGGGQVSDTAVLMAGSLQAPITHIQKLGDALGATVEAPGNLRIGDEICITVDADTRRATMRNHTATHLLQAALVERLGKSIKQAGSYVSPEYIRFDFTYHEALSPEDIAAIERRVCEIILDNVPTDISHSTYQEALAQGVTAFFGEKYNPDDVRVVRIPGYSAELCGGTHVRATGDIGCFKIIESTALSAGTRRIVAVTGIKALEQFQESFGAIKFLTTELKTKPTTVVDAVQKIREQLKLTEKRCESATRDLYKALVTPWTEQAQTVNDTPYAVIHIPAHDNGYARDITTLLQQKRPGVYAVCAPVGDRVTCAISAHTSCAINMHDLHKAFVAAGGKGGLQQNTIQGSIASTVDLAHLIRQLL